MTLSSEKYGSDMVAKYTKIYKDMIIIIYF